MKNKVIRFAFILISLLLLLCVSSAIAFLPLAHWNWVGCLLISLTMSALIICFFMKALTSEPLIALTASSGPIWLGIMFLYVILDYISRPWPH